MGAAGTADEMLLSEFDMMTDDMIKQWKDVVEKGIEEQAAAQGVEPGVIPGLYATEQITQIQNLGYKLSEEAIMVLTEAFSAFFKCSIGPAPFSAHSVAANEVSDTDITVSCAGHPLPQEPSCLPHCPGARGVHCAGSLPRHLLL